MVKGISHVNKAVGLVYRGNMRLHVINSRIPSQFCGNNRLWTWQYFTLCLKFTYNLAEISTGILTLII